ncbi:hypothetical protein ACWDYH_05235 [Nocardia goodfellowii]
MNPYPGPYHGYPPYVRPPQHPQANTAMVLGIVALVGTFMCPLLVVLGPFAWVLGKRAMDEIDDSAGALGSPTPSAAPPAVPLGSPTPSAAPPAVPLGGRGNAQAGYICGIIATVLLSLGVAAFLTIIIAAMVAAPG